MSSRPDRLCHTSGKVRYDQRTVLKAIDRLQRRRKGKAEKRYYWCRDCQAFHLTSREGP